MVALNGHTVEMLENVGFLFDVTEKKGTHKVSRLSLWLLSLRAEPTFMWSLERTSHIKGYPLKEQPFPKWKPLFMWYSQS